MAWITVDQKLIGGKLRELTKRLGCSQNEAIGILIRLWLWGIDNAEESGAIVAGEREDIAEAIRPGFQNPPDGRIEEVVDGLIECQWIDEVDGRLFLHDWMDWRKYYSGYMAGKEKHATRMRVYREKVKTNPPKKTRSKNPYTEGFEAFWKHYPRKKDKGIAYKKYKARLNDGFSEEELLEAATNYSEQCKRLRTEERYIKHASTFLSDSTPFLDYVSKKGEAQDAAQEQGGNPFL